MMITRPSLFIVTVMLWVFQSTALPADEINQKVARLEITSAGIEEVIAVFGPPQIFRWGPAKFTQDDLPDMYIAGYDGGFSVFIRRNKIVELRFEGQDGGFRFEGKLGIGSTLQQALDVLGPPSQTVENETNQWADRVLYKDIDGHKGQCYYSCSDQNIRLFFADYKITALFITNPGESEDMNFHSNRIDSVTPYADIRGKDVRRALRPADRSLVRTFIFNEDTVWPELEFGKIPLKAYVEKLLEDAKNPGLGVQRLHQQGITGKGVTVAIIDQPLYLNHPEYAGKIIEYHDVGCGGSQSSMHGPAVASLLVGTQCGTAPDAKIYYVAAPSWTQDTAYQAAALDWLVEKNSQLPTGQKIRAVSVSAAPSGPGSPFTQNTELWDQACRRAEAAGMMVLDCTQHRGFIRRGYFHGTNIQTPLGCVPGSPDSPQQGNFSADHLYVPSCPRTTAEQWTEDKTTYIYWSKGGTSWTIPYCTGVLAMGWQIKPDATCDQMKDLLLKTAYQTKDGAKIIAPARFIQALQRL